MLIEHEGSSPRLAESAYVAPNAVLCGDVAVGEDARILFGAVLTAEGGRVEIGARAIVMENALVRGRRGHPATLGAHVLVGPHAHVNGATIEDEAFLGTGARSAGSPWATPPSCSHPTSTTSSGRSSAAWTSRAPSSASRARRRPWRRWRAATRSSSGATGKTACSTSGGGIQRRRDPGVLRGWSP